MLLENIKKDKNYTEIDGTSFETWSFSHQMCLRLIQQKV